MEQIFNFHAVFERHGRWYVGYIPEVPGVNAQEKTLKSARHSLVSALRELAELDPDTVFRPRRRVESIAMRRKG